MELRHLQALVVLAEERHFGRAARRLHVVQSAVTRTIQGLEDEVGTVLFHRDRRRVVLTPAGEALLVRARALLEAADRAARECREVGEGHVGTLRIALSGLSGVGLLPEALAAFRERRPQVAVELRRMSAAAQVSALGEGEIDLAVSHVALEDDRLRVERLRPQRLYTILRAGHPLAAGRAVPWSELEGEVHVVLSRGVEPEVFRTFERVAKNLGARRLKFVEVDDVSHMFALVAGGLGVSHLPEDGARVGFRGVVALPIEPAVKVPLFAALAKEGASPLAAELLSLLRAG
jgi:DNA-binding transcriptional LysR family regulator